MKFGFVVFNGMQLMDLVGPLEVLNMWREIDKSIEILLVAESRSAISCGSGFTLQADHTFADSPQLDYICVPGGSGRLNEVNNAPTINFLRQQYANCKLMMSVCTGMFLLHKAGLLTNHSATTYWRALPELADDSSINLVEERIVKSGNLWTSGGVTSGIDLMFAVICEVAGKHVAGQVQLMFEYFPSNVVYGDTSDVEKLPQYPTEKLNKIRVLPKYITDYMESK